jgi:hypothetical protein
MFIAPALFLNGQNNNFKIRQKNPVGTLKPDIFSEQVYCFSCPAFDGFVT